MLRLGLSVIDENIDVIKCVPLSTSILVLMSKDVEKYVVSMKLEGLATVVKVIIGEAVAVNPSPCSPAEVLLVPTDSVASDFVIL